MEEEAKKVKRSMMILVYDTLFGHFKWALFEFSIEIEYFRIRWSQSDFFSCESSCVLACSLLLDAELKC